MKSLKTYIDPLPEDLRELALQYLKRTRVRRRRVAYGSQRYSKNHPEHAIPQAEKAHMKLLHEKGNFPFRPLERLFGLADNSGNNAQRCVREATKEAQAQPSEAQVLQTA